MRVALSELQIGDRFLGKDGEYWTVNGVSSTHVKVVRKGREAIEAPRTDQASVDVMNRDDSLTHQQAQRNIEQEGLI